MDTDKHGNADVITDLHIKFLGKSHWDLLEVKVSGGSRSCVLSLRGYKKIFPNSFTTNGLAKPSVLQSENHFILESYRDGILLVHGTVILKVAHYKTGKLMPIRFFVVDTKKETIISHVASTQLGFLKVLCHNRATQNRQLHSIKTHPP